MDRLAGTQVEAHDAGKFHGVWWEVVWPAFGRASNITISEEDRGLPAYIAIAGGR